MSLERAYKYTKGNSVLTKVQRDFYEDNGYILVRDLVRPELLDEMKQRFVDICEKRVDSLVLTVAKDPSLKKKGLKGEFVVSKIQDFTLDDVLFKYCCDKNIVNVVEDIIGPDIVAAHSMLINKPPDANADTSLHPLHQDMVYFPFRPAENIVASWTAMQHVDEENGCLYVLPGSHKGVMLKHGENEKNKMYHGVQGFENEKKVWLPMNKGDTAFFHPILLHGSGPNLTKGFRKAISCHYASGSCHFIDVKGTIQENVAQDIVAIARKRGGYVSIQDLWRFKSRVVKGNPGSFSLLSSHL